MTSQIACALTAPSRSSRGAPGVVRSMMVDGSALVT
jgi:hypothetical protein